MQWCCRARSYTVFHSSMTYIRAVNRSVNIGSELKLGARARTYQRPATPYRRVTGHPTTPSVPGEHGPTRPCPLRAAHGTHRAPRAAARTHPRDGARGRRKQRSCAAALHTAAGCGRFARTRPMLADAAGPSAAAGTAVRRPAAAAVARPATAVATSAVLGGRLAAASRRPECLRGAASGVASVSTGTGARLVQHVAGHGHVSEG